MLNRIFLILTLAITTSSLSGCFKPVYLPDTENNESLRKELSEVAIDSIEGYLGYSLRSELDFLLTGGVSAGQKNKRYLLKIETKELKTANIINTSTGRAQTAFLQVEAVYLLLDKQQKDKIRASGRILSSASYDRSQLHFTTLRAERDAEKKAAKSLAEKIRTIIIAALSDPSSHVERKAVELSAPYMEDQRENETE